MNKEILKTYERIILGIDPGTNIMGFGIIGIRAKEPHYIHMDSVNLTKVSDTYMKLERIYRTVQDIVDDFLPDELAIEAPFYGKNVQSMLKLGRAQGVAMAAALSRQVPIAEYEPRKVKLSITGRGGATKEQVRDMLFRILQVDVGQQKLTLDSTDALAIALCHFYESSKKIKTSGSKSWNDFIKQNPDKVIKRKLLNK